MLTFLTSFWSKISIYAAAVLGAIAAVGVALLYGLHKGNQAGQATVAAKAASKALQDSLAASKAQSTVTALPDGAAQQELAKNWSREQSDGKI